MDLANETTVQEFILLGLENGQEKRFYLLVLFSFTYIITLIENTTIIILAHVDDHLVQLPMYILLGNFSTTMPRMIFDLASPQGTISFQACFLQFYVFFSFGSTECFFLSAMVLDCYLAICHPLRYPTVMSPRNCSKLVAGSWVAGFLGYAVPVTLISRLSFCGSNIIDNFVCDQGLLSLACSPFKNASYISQISMNILIILGNFVFVTISYGFVIATLIKSSNQHSRKKAFSTISFHLIVVILFYGSVAGMYVAPSGDGQSHTAPFLNPMIYYLRNDRVKEALRRLLRRMEQRLREKK